MPKIVRFRETGEAAGIVDAVGPGVGGIQIGDRVSTTRLLDCARMASTAKAPLRSTIRSTIHGLTPPRRPLVTSLP